MSFRTVPTKVFGNEIHYLQTPTHTSIRIPQIIVRENTKKVDKLKNQLITLALKALPSGETLMCGICLEELKDKELMELGSDSCIHLFCKECIDEWHKQSDQCPMCRQK